VPQNNGVTRRSGFQSGVSGNPGGRPRGLARTARAAVGDDGQRLVEFWLGVMDDERASRRDRLESSKLLADRAVGKVIVQAPFHDVGMPVVMPDVDRRPTRERMLALLDLARELEVPDEADALRNGH